MQALHVGSTWRQCPDYAQNSVPPCWAREVLKLNLSGESVFWAASIPACFLFEAVDFFFLKIIVTGFCHDYEMSLHENKWFQKC